MKRIIIIIFSIVSFSSLFAQSAQEKVKQGNEAYESGQFDQAIEIWESVLAEGKECGELYYNLGNAYYRTEQWGKCLLNYERALRLMPNDRDLKENIALANSKTEDRTSEIPELFFVRWWNNFLSHHSAQGWMNLCIFIALLLGTCLVVFFLAHDYAIRKWTLVGNFVLGAFLLLFAICATSTTIRASIHEDAIVQETVTMAKGSPDVKSVDKFLLHEGTKVHIEEQSGSWIKVRKGDGETGWIDNGVVEII